MTAAYILRMIDIRMVEHHGEVVYDYRSRGFKTLNEHWMVMGKRFDHAPTEEEVSLAYERDDK